MKKFDTLIHVSKHIMLNCAEFHIVDVNNHPEGTFFLELHFSNKRRNKSESIFFFASETCFHTFTSFVSQMSVK